ncbi:MAG: phage holin family protein [Natronospirillum sp.]|uniref:phage holin family protein n=1 Tax=Natronospirillum sp. TaxID=2812955 RepID=UPI0025F66F38|nr:phage holin family protein [Natronospirillum sp.]MCH8551006.1 phage holin family protein [Natronospirillum sp.]
MAGAEAPSTSGLLNKGMSGLLNEFRSLAHDHLELAALETRLSVYTLLRMVVVSSLTALVLVSAWLALAGSAAMGLIGNGLDPALALLFVAVANLLLAVMCWLWIRRMSQSLGWPATQRAIKPVDTPEEVKRGAE